MPDERRGYNSDPFTNYRYNPEHLCRELEARGHAWAEAKYQEEMLDRRRKTIRAQLMKHFIAHGDAIGKAEAHAMAHPDYVAVVEGLDEAVRKHAHAKVAYDAWSEYIGLLRTANATARAEMGLGGLSP